MTGWQKQQEKKPKGRSLPHSSSRLWSKGADVNYFSVLSFGQSVADLFALLCGDDSARFGFCGARRRLLLG